MHRPATDNACLDAPIWRRLAAIVYDSVIVIALLMVATAALLPLSHGEAIAADNVWFKLYLLLIGTGFFVLFWHKGGQTVGMRAWRIQLVHAQPGCTPGVPALTLRAVAALLSWALLGLGFIWCFFDPHGSGLHDRVSNTRLIRKTT